MKRRKILSAVLACFILCVSIVPTALAAEGDAPGYLFTGSAASGTYTLNIQIQNVYAYTGRIGLVYDTSKLTLQGGDSIKAFKMHKDVTATAESLAETELISAANGYAGTAWYSLSGLDAVNAPVTLATLTFAMKDGVTAADIDASTFMLRVVEIGSLYPWTASASIQGDDQDDNLVVFEYLTKSRPLAVDFAYDGSDTVPANGKTVRFRSVNVQDMAVPAVLTLGGKTYTIGGEGVLELILAPGTYQYRAEAENYGNVDGVLTVSGDQEVTVTFVSDADLVQKATNELEIGYQTGDSAEKVTASLVLPSSTDTGVSISWSSDNPSVINNGGVVFLPAATGVKVNLTATLTRGSATETKTFTFYVCSKAELRPALPNWSPEDVNQKPGEEADQPAKIKFADLAGFQWAEDAILRMAEAGIIKGTSATTFEPGANIKRGDFVLLLMRMFNTDASPGEAFGDVPADSYYYEAIAQARALGIAQGTGDNRFTPEEPITRQEMITFVMRALDKIDYLTLSGAKDDLTAFTDRALVEDYAFDSMAAAVAEGLIVGSDGRLNPTGNTTRAEAAVFIARIYDAHNSRGDSR